MTHFASWEMLREAERCCHEVRFETRKCVKMRFRPGLGPGPHWGSLQRSPKLLAGAWSWMRGTERDWKWLGVERERKGKERNGQEREKRGSGMEFRGEWARRMERRNGKGYRKRLKGGEGKEGEGRRERRGNGVLGGVCVRLALWGIDGPVSINSYT